MYGSHSRSLGPLNGGSGVNKVVSEFLVEPWLTTVSFQELGVAVSLGNGFRAGLGEVVQSDRVAPGWYVAVISTG